MTQASAAIQVLVGYSQGSASNILAQAVCPTLSKLLGQAIDIVPLPGDNGALAAARLAGARADGLTLGITVQAQVVGSLLDEQRRYDPLRDFSPIALFSRNPMVLLVSNSLNVHSAAELIALAKARPGELAYGVSAVGGMPHLAAALFASMAGIDIRMRVYAETNVLFEDLVAGRIALSLNNPMLALPLAKAGKIGILATTGVTPSALAPEFPTLAQTALPGYEVVSWVGLWGPAGMPEDQVNRLNSAMTQTVETPAVSKALREQGVEPVAEPPAYFAQRLRETLARWQPFISANPGALSAST